MCVLLASLLFSLRRCLQTRAALHAENLALRHQLLLLQRVHQNRRLRLRSCDRLVWVWLSRVWSNWRSALCIVKPETVIAWHRQGFRLYWKWKSRVRHGRPSYARRPADPAARSIPWSPSVDLRVHKSCHAAQYLSNFDPLMSVRFVPAHQAKNCNGQVRRKPCLIPEWNDGSSFVCSHSGDSALLGQAWYCAPQAQFAGRKQLTSLY